MPTATITSKGQITIPKRIRDELDLQPGDILSFNIESGNKITIRPEKESSEIAYGILERDKQEALSIEEMDSGVAEYFKEKYKAQ